VGAVLAALLLAQVHPASEELPFVQQCLTVFMQVRLRAPLCCCLARPLRCLCLSTRAVLLAALQHGMDCQCARPVSFWDCSAPASSPMQRWFAGRLILCLDGCAAAGAGTCSAHGLGAAGGADMRCCLTDMRVRCRRTPTQQPRMQPAWRLPCPALPGRRCMCPYLAPPLLPRWSSMWRSFCTTAPPHVSCPLPCWHCGAAPYLLQPHNLPAPQHNLDCAASVPSREEARRREAVCAQCHPVCFSAYMQQRVRVYTHASTTRVSSTLLPCSWCVARVSSPEGCIRSPALLAGYPCCNIMCWWVSC
jgi:hypothetical protein